MNAIQFQFKFDAQKILQELQAITDAFISIHSLRIKEGHMNGLHLITPNTNNQKDEKGYTYHSTPELDQSPYLQSILDSFPCNKLTYRVHNLRPKGKIELHRDLGSGLLDKVVRIHIPVTTNDEVYFYVNQERVIMQNGECWFADISKLHEVENRSDTNRLHLMIDCDLNDWWEALLNENGIQLEHISEWDKYSLSELKVLKENFRGADIPMKDVMMEGIDRAIASKVSF